MNLRWVFEFTNFKLKIMKIHQSSKCILSFLAKLKIQFCVFEIFECFIQWERCVSWQISVSIIFKNQIQNCSAMKTDSGPLRNFKNSGSRKFFDGSIENYFNIKYIYNFLVCLHFIQIYAQRDIAIFDILFAWRHQHVANIHSNDDSFNGSQAGHFEKTQNIDSEKKSRID